jgi:DNA polymerase I-like protein with 3'-5' exonuclease and polymerase domains
MEKLKIYLGVDMLLQADAKQLEWVGATYLSQDQVALNEIWGSVDQHSDNQTRFGLPSRLVAKTFVFRLIYGGSAYSYANDPNFRDIGNEKFWQKVIDQFYDKYKELHKWHAKLMDDVKRDRKLTMPTGRTYNFEPELKYNRAEWPRTKILNYPVQGLGADLMAIARVSLKNRLKDKEGVLLVNTVHDSIILDFNPDIWDNISIVNLVDKCFNDIPANFQKLFGKNFNLPMRVECQIGPTWGNMEIVNANYSN